jgi:hypothetical protein
MSNFMTVVSIGTVQAELEKVFGHPIRTVPCPSVAAATSIPRIQRDKRLGLDFFRSLLEEPRVLRGLNGSSCWLKSAYNSIFTLHPYTNTGWQTKLLRASKADV